jgi:hypothetical protein
MRSELYNDMKYNFWNKADFNIVTKDEPIGNKENGKKELKHISKQISIL